MTICIFQGRVFDWQSDFEVRTFEVLETTKIVVADLAILLPLNDNIDWSWFYCVAKFAQGMTNCIAGAFFCISLLLYSASPI